MANRNFNRRQALEKEVKDVYAAFTLGTPTKATASLATTSAISLTHINAASANGVTVTVHVSAAAANPTDTILANVSGSASAISITLVPNDGTNNTATPVTWTSANLAEFLDTGSVTGKTVTVTDASSLLANIDAATGGDTTVLAHSGNGDGVVATFASGADNITNNSVAGIASVSRNAAGDYSIVLQDAYVSLKLAHAILQSSSAQDFTVQVKSETVASTKEVKVLTLTSGTKTDPAASTKILVHLALKNSSVAV